MIFNVYDNKTGNPKPECIYAISGTGVLYRLYFGCLDYMKAVPVQKDESHAIQYFIDVKGADGNTFGACPMEVY